MWYFRLPDTVFYAFINDKIDTTNVSNVGFLMLIAIANICFTWARSLEKESLKVGKDLLNTNGGLAIITSIFFLFGSLFKYIYTKSNSDDMVSMFLGGKHVNQILFNIGYSLCFSIAGLLTMAVLAVVIVVYFRMEELIWEIDKDESIKASINTQTKRITYISFKSNKQRKTHYWRKLN